MYKVKAESRVWEVVRRIKYTEASRKTFPTITKHNKQGLKKLVSEGKLDELKND